ncbi:MAG: hypothetical protein IT472_02280 [Thermomonas sp.]|uniref:phosphatase PAP2 family protein n=1 Tax=Thermomonas sp. TaxID=1971895 RepID=UPI00261BC698|nr:phosphatase PAP2 family protein [Thermomonas sp.]MCC7095995.1 hypothetical protein [Thermomonas sp.]
MPIFWIRFYQRQCLLLAASGLVIASLFHGNHLDLLLADPFYDLDNRLWPYRNAWWAKTLVHSWLKNVLILAALIFLWTAWRHRRAADRLRWRLVACSIIAVPLTVTLWKRVTSMHCPWNIDRFDGAFPYFDLLSTSPIPLPGPGRCFPAGFVSTAGWLLAFALVRYPENPRFSRNIGGGALVLCLFFGLVQQMRGAHFMSHVLWTIWLSWAIVVLLHALLGVWKQPTSPT